jgi:hypothetical protein
MIRSVVVFALPAFAALPAGCARPSATDALASAGLRPPSGYASEGGSECPASGRVVWRGSFRRAGWLEDWDPGARFAYGAENARVIADGRFGRVLRIVYPAGSSSNSYAKEGHPVGGLEFKVRLPGASSSSRVVLSYWLRFAPNFPWMRGGKLPGLCGGTCPSGGAVVSGFGGWSLRGMWRPRGLGEEYAYILPAQAYGTELGLGAWTFTAGQWQHLTQEVVLNTGEAANGAARVWFDVDPSRAPTFEATGLTYRRDKTRVDTLFFSTFFGGHDASWATPVDTYVDFADFIVCGEPR